MTEKTAYTLLGLLVVIIAGGVFFAINNKEEKNDTSQTSETHTMLTLTSSVFEHNGSIPSKYTCDGENINPELSISGVPEGTESLVLLMDDPDIPDVVKESRGIEKFDHWVVYNLHPSKLEVSETETFTKDDIVYAMRGVNSAGTNEYRGPCPPDKEHRYFFKLYALDRQLNLFEGATKMEVEKAMEGHILEQTELIGLYDRKK